MPTPPNPIRIADCGDCGESFVLPDDAAPTSNDDLTCPACGARQGGAGLATRELRAASIAPTPPEVSEPVVSEPIASASEPAAEAPEEIEASLPVETAQAEAPPETPRPSAQPSLADWLTRDQPKEPAAEAAEPVPAAPTPAKQPLSATLGWSPTRFDATAGSDAAPPAVRLDSTPPTPAPQTAPEAIATAPEQPPATKLDDFRFDFGKALLEETAGEEPAPAEAVELAEPSEPPSDASVPAPRRRSWSGPLSALAGLLVVAAPAAYYGVDWQGMGEAVAQLDASSNRSARFDLSQDDDPALEPSAGASPAADTPEAVPTPEPASDRYRDRSAVPASFEVDAQPGANAESVGGRYGAAREEEPNPFAVAEAMAADPLPETPSPESPADDGAPVETPAVTSNAAPVGTPPSEEADVDQAATPATFNAPMTHPLPADPLPPAAEPASLTPVPRDSVARAPVSRNGLVGAPAYPIEDLRAALDAGAPAGAEFADGTLSDPDSVPAMGKHYARLCYLAQVLTLFDTESPHPDRLTTELEAAEVFKRLFREEGPRLDSQQIAGPWIAWTGRPHGGVFFAGVPTGSDLRGDVSSYYFELNGEPVTVVTDEPIDASRFINAGAKEIGILGVVVEQPAERIAGYTGDEQRVVWARKTLPLARPQPLR